MITIMRNRKANIIIALIGAFMVIVAGFFLVKKLVSTSKPSKGTSTGITQDASAVPDVPIENAAGSSQEESGQKHHKPMITDPSDAQSSTSLPPQKDEEENAGASPDNEEERNAVEPDDNEEQTESAESNAGTGDDGETIEE